MLAQETITGRDLQLLADISDPSRMREDGDPLPWSVLGDLVQLVRCDRAGFVSYDAHRHTGMDEQAVEASDAPREEQPASQVDEMLDIFWANFWTWPASHPQRTGDWTTIIRDADFSMNRRAVAAKAEFHRLMGSRHALVVPLPPHGVLTQRIMLWRDDGIDFSDREVLLLRLIRPHLGELCAAGLRRRTPQGELTSRQYELLRMVAGGQTNRQIARHLSISEGTVRKHLENIFQRLGASNRTSAVERAFSTH
ncbi:MAG TPA: LuxR C-terminal-related transcriptional regulator [Jatrophihabitans sp.]|jgi:DNA-binding CsgD family transcriptional regulator|nr:LuxR C-terminal-related transcriptional regulator [Jatrophihabitans sp.]